MLLTPDIKNQITAQAIANPKEEVCGVILANGSIAPCTNTAADKAQEFIIATAEFSAVQSSAVAIYHSHCLESQPAMLSESDIANSKAAKLPYTLYHTIFKQWDYYDPADINPYPLVQNPWSPKELGYYLGWRFDYGRCDCYTLIRSYYQGMLGITLPDFPRGDISETTSPKWNMFLENFQAAGGRKLAHGEPWQANDVALMRVAGTQVHHAAILLDPKNGKALHNLGEGRISEIFKYGGYWATNTHAICRYTSNAKA